MKKLIMIMVLFLSISLNVKASELMGIMIDGESLKDFDSEKLVYDLAYPSDKEKVIIGPVYDKEKYQISTSGGNSFELKSGINVYTITVISLEDETDTKTYKLNITREDNRSNDNTLSSLIVDDKKVQLEKDKTDYEVSIANDAKTVEIKATLNNSNASFVEGYGERIGNNKVTLATGPKTVVEIKVKAENEKDIRTYKITLVKSNYKNNDATLKDIKIKEKNFNFNPNTLEYNIEVTNDINKINIEALPNDSKAKVEYDKTVNLKVGVNTITLIVTAEDGSSKTYKLNITRNKKVPLVNNIQIEGIDFEFENGVYEYEIETTLTTLNFIITLNSKTATYEVLDNDDLKAGSIIKVQVKDNEEEETYRFKIVSPKEEIVIDKKPDDNKLDDAGTNVGGSGFLKKYEMYIGLITFGVGLLSLLVAILLKPKGSQIM